MFTLLPYRLQEVLQLALNSAHRVLQKNAQCHTEEGKKRKKRGGTIGVGSTTLPTERDLPPPPSKRQRLDGGREGGVACKAGEAGGGGLLQKRTSWIHATLGSSLPAAGIRFWKSTPQATAGTSTRSTTGCLSSWAFTAKSSSRASPTAS